MIRRILFTFAVVAFLPLPAVAQSGVGVISSGAGTIGTSTPTTCATTRIFFANAGFVDCSGNLTYSEASGPRLTVGSTGTSAGVIAGYSGTSGVGGLWNSILTPSTTNGLFLDTNGRVGIGTTSPSYLFSLGSVTKGFAEYTSGTVNSAIKAVGNNAGAIFGIQNVNVGGFSGIEYLDESSAVAVFTGFANGGTGEFRFNNIAANGFIDFRIAGASKLKIANDGTLQTGGLALTSATMTLGTAASLKSVTSSYTWTNAQVVALGAALEGDITVATLPAKTQVLDAIVVITGQGAGTTTLTVSCGDAIAGTPFINYIVASDAQAAANTVYGDAVAERGTSIDTEFWYLPSYTATTLVTCHFIATGANLDQVTGSTGRVILTTRTLP